MIHAAARFGRVGRRTCTQPSRTFSTSSPTGPPVHAPSGESMRAEPRGAGPGQAGVGATSWAIQARARVGAEGRDEEAVLGGAAAPSATAATATATAARRTSR